MCTDQLLRLAACWYCLNGLLLSDLCNLRLRDFGLACVQQRDKDVPEPDIIYAPFDLPPQWFLAYCYCFFYLWVIVPGECPWIVTAALLTTNCALCLKLLLLCAIIFRALD